MENIELAKYRKIAERVYSKLERNRAYALEAAGGEALAAFCKAWNDAGNSLSNMVGDDGKTGEDHFGQVLQALGEYIPGLFQAKPDEAPKLPEWPVDPFGRPLPNPFDKATSSLAAQSKLMARDPALAKAMKAAAEDPRSFFFDVEEAKQKREHRAAISYTAADHTRNPFVAGNLTEQSEFVKRGDPARVENYKREAEPVKLPFTPGSVELTVRGALYAKHPRLYQWCENARQTCERWRAEEIAALEKEKAQAQARLEKLQKETAHKTEPIRIVAPIA
jgi:hypothetical protein